jgi:hypothetical protein
MLRVMREYVFARSLIREKSSYATVWKELMFVILGKSASVEIVDFRSSLLNRSISFTLSGITFNCVSNVSDLDGPTSTQYLQTSVLLSISVTCSEYT